MKKIILMICLLLMVNTVLAYDLASIEDVFVDGDDITCYVVVDGDGTSSDVLAQLEIITYLGRFIDGPTTGIGKLTSEIDGIYEKDLITIGNPCVSSVTKDVMDYDGDCNFDEGLIKFYNKNDKVQLVLYGAGEKSTREAAKSISNKEVSGEEAVVDATSEEIEEKKQKEMDELLKKIEENKEEEVVEDVVVEDEPVEEESNDGERIQVQLPEEPVSLWQKIVNFFRKLFGLE